MGEEQSRLRLTPLLPLDLTVLSLGYCVGSAESVASPTALTH